MMNFSNFCLVVLLSVLAPIQGAHEDGVPRWTYKISENGLDPDNWEKDYKECGGKGQSPIDIPVFQADLDQSLTGLNLSNWGDIPENLTITNNGHSATVTVTGNFTFSGANLPGTFRVAQFHLHWGETNGRGSEHLIDGEQYPGELHIVAWNDFYANLSEAATKTDGLAVIGIMLEIGSYEKDIDEGEPNNKLAYRTIETQLAYVIEPGSSSEVPTTFSMFDLLPDDLYPLYRYHGSLTTPGCYESVTWTVLDQEVDVPRTFVKALRRLRDSMNEPLVDNFRPVLPLNGRHVTKCCF